MSDIDKLPAWPEKPHWDETSGQWIQFYLDNAGAYRARMEALVEYAKHKRTCLKGIGGDPAYLCDCGLDALLAACEREEGR